MKTILLMVLQGLQFTSPTVTETEQSCSYLIHWLVGDAQVCPLVLYRVGLQSEEEHFGSLWKLGVGGIASLVSGGKVSEVFQIP